MSLEMVQRNLGIALFMTAVKVSGENDLLNATPNVPTPGTFLGTSI